MKLKELNAQRKVRADKRCLWEAAVRSTGLGWAQVQVEPVPGSAPVSGCGCGSFSVSVGLMEVVGSASH